MPRLEQLEALLAAEPDDVFLNYSLAMELIKAGRHEESVARLGRVIELNPDYITAYLQRGKLLLQMGDRQGAKEVLLAGIDRAQASGAKHAKSMMEELLSAM